MCDETGVRDLERLERDVADAVEQTLASAEQQRCSKCRRGDLTVSRESGILGIGNGGLGLGGR
jgi:hypothetical protein